MYALRLNRLVAPARGVCVVTSILDRAAKQILSVHVVTICVIAFIATGGGSVDLSKQTILGGFALLMAVSASSIAIRCLAKGNAHWDHQLAALDTEQCDPLQLPRASGATPAERGWNRLIDQGCRWQALSELERAVARRLEAGGVGDAAPLLDALADGVVVVDAVGAITYANAVACAICGSDSPDQLMGRTLPQLIGVENPTENQWQESSSQAQTPIEWSVSIGGTVRTLRGSRRPMRTNNRRGSAGFVWTIRDVTQQRLADAMRDQFLSAATHEFRTPLANIRAYAEALDMGQGTDAEAQKRFYNVIQSESTRLAQLVDDLLDISRMQAGALSLESRETDLGRLVEEASAKVQAELREKRIHYRCELPPKFPKVVVDKGKLTAAIVNLLGNAVKYTPAGGKVTFRVDVGHHDIHFSVVDTGFGIASDEVSKVFDRFFRSQDDRVQGITGSGLGLALTQEIARLHGGRVSVESTLNQGSTFRLTIPLQLAA